MKSELVNKYYDDAKKMIDGNYPEQALQCVRNCLEAALKTICKEYGLDYETKNANDSGVSLHDMIEALLSNGIITEYEAGVLHETRMLGNAVNHVSIDNINACSIDDAKRGYKNLGTVLSILDRIGKDSDDNPLPNLSDPMLNPDYYSKSRRYWGKWSNCFTREDLLSIPDYVQLYNKANNNRDIGAMLDIATGFLSDKTTWDEATGLLNMPKYVGKGGKIYNTTRCYDERYYSWISYAVSMTLTDYASGIPFESIERRYICTALLETLKSRFYKLSFVSYYNPLVFGEENRIDPTELARKMCDEVGCAYYFLQSIDPSGSWNASMLLDMIEKYSVEAIDMIQREKPEELIKKIKFMYYVIAERTSEEKDPILIQEKLALSEEDVGKAVTQEMIEKHCLNDNSLSKMVEELSSQKKALKVGKTVSTIHALKVNRVLIIVGIIIIIFFTNVVGEILGSFVGFLFFVGATVAMIVYLLKRLSNNPSKITIDELFSTLKSYINSK